MIINAIKKLLRSSPEISGVRFKVTILFKISGVSASLGFYNSSFQKAWNAKNSKKRRGKINSCC
jgi:hypothetical protein